MGVCFFTRPSFAIDTYQNPESFLKEAFPNATPQAEVLWITKTRGEAARRILGHNFAALRQRYWRNGERTVWILDEIGKMHPITILILNKTNNKNQVKQEINLVTTEELKKTDIQI